VRGYSHARRRGILDGNLERKATGPAPGNVIDLASNGGRTWGNGATEKEGQSSPRTASEAIRRLQTLAQCAHRLAMMQLPVPKCLAALGDTVDLRLPWEILLEAGVCDCGAERIDLR